MFCLALDTSSIASSAALYNMSEKKLVASNIKIFEGKKKAHSENLLVQIDELMKSSKLEFQDLSNVMVTIGPGSFTGIRVALAAARAMILPLNINIIPINCLQAIAANHIYDNPSGTFNANINNNNDIMVIIDAKRNQSYYQMFDHNLSELTAPQLEENEKIIEQILSLENNTSLLTNQPEILNSIDVRGNKLVELSDAKTYPSAKNFAYLSNFLKPSNAPPAPLYIRKPDAEKPKKTNYLL